MATVTVNGETTDITAEETIGAFLERSGYDRSKVATAINGLFVSRRDYDNRTLKDGDEIDIVAPMQGG